MLAVFTRVTVGKTECECVYQTPAVFRRSNCGIVAGVIESGRSPSMTSTITSAGRSLTAAVRERHARRNRIVVFMTVAALHFPTVATVANDRRVTGPARTRHWWYALRMAAR